MLSEKKRSCGAGMLTVALSCLNVIFCAGTHRLSKTFSCWTLVPAFVIISADVHRNWLLEWQSSVFHDRELMICRGFGTLTSFQIVWYMQKYWRSRDCRFIRTDPFISSCEILFILKSFDVEILYNLKQFCYSRVFDLKLTFRNWSGLRNVVSVFCRRYNRTCTEFMVNHARVRFSHYSAACLCV